MNQITAIGSCVEIVVPITPLDGFERNTLASTYIIIVSRDIFFSVKKCERYSIFNFVSILVISIIVNYCYVS